MAETETQVEMVLVTYACDECGEPMEATGTTRVSGALAPPVYDHRCANGHRAFLLKYYPSVEHRAKS